MRQQKLETTQTTARSSREGSEIAKPVRHPVLQLQADIGNRATSYLIYEQGRQNAASGLSIQAKPMFGGLSRELSGRNPIQARELTHVEPQMSEAPCCCSKESADAERVQKQEGEEGVESLLTKHPSNYIQRAKLKDIGTDIESETGEARKDALHRTLRSYKIEKAKAKKGSSSKKNRLTATYKRNDRNITLHLTSAGMGGQHPKDDGKSASHTEQQLLALVKSQKANINKIVDNYHKEQKHQIPDDPNTKKMEIESIYSTNEACNKNPSMKEGCGSINTEDLGLSAGAKMYYHNEYKTGGDKGTKTRAKMMKSMETELGKKAVLRRQDSDDIVIDSEQLRGKDIENLTEAELEGMMEINPAL